MKIEKKDSLDAKDLLTKSEIYEIKAGKKTNSSNSDVRIEICTTNCIACTTCVSCNSRMMDVIF